MSQITEEIKDRIKTAAVIEDIIGVHTSLTKRGANYVGCCPFHSEKTPSFSVSPAKGIYKCFGCGKQGDVIQFLVEAEKLSFPEAVEQLGRKYGIEIPKLEKTSEQVESEKKRESMFVMLQHAAEQFKANLQTNVFAKSYLQEKRQFTDETLEAFGAGYAMHDNQFAKELTKKGFKFEVMQACGLTNVSEKGYQYDVFRDRVVVPYFNLSGRVIGFTGRILTEDKEQAKYLNTPETSLFVKGSVIFGLKQAREEIIRTGKAYFFEGNLDVMSCWQNGLKNSVCGSGTAFTDAHARLLKRFTNTVSIVFDGDTAGLKASIACTKILLAHGFDVRAVRLPNGMDPDDLANQEGENLAKKILSLEMDFIKYFAKAKEIDAQGDFVKNELLEQLLDCISSVPDAYLREQYANTIATTFGTTYDVIKPKIKPAKELKVDKWKHGFFGIDEAVEMLTKQEDDICRLTFSQEEFIKCHGEEPIVCAYGKISTTDMQTMISRIGKVLVTDEMPKLQEDLKEPKELSLLKLMYNYGFEVKVEAQTETDDDNSNTFNFIEYYIAIYSNLLARCTEISGSNKGVITERCAEIIAAAPNTHRTVMMELYAQQLKLKVAVLKDILKPYLAKKKDKAALDTQRLQDMANIIRVDAEEVPAYVYDDEILAAQYHRSQFYPLLDTDKRPVAYMFKNEKSSSHSCISDFFIEPLLHVYDNKNEGSNNKRVVKLCHMDKRLDRYVEWKSSYFSNMNKINEKLIEEGAYNFDGNPFQFKKIWKHLSYGFVYCTEIRVFGQQPEGFFAFGNAILHKVNDEYQVEYMNDLGLVTHEEKNYYSPAFSKIHLNSREENDGFKQSRNLRYKEIKDTDKIDFSEWAELMDKVYSINDNGKWALLYAFTCAFRDFIFKNKRYFTALFFIGPTSSGKSQVAESIRNLFMDACSPTFNLNTGTDASMFMLLESIRNVPVVMEEYNDKSISPTKFQGLKSATLDGEGKIKVKDANSKSMDSSEINASIVILGQEASQQDDGALSNRCIMCDVPYRPSGGFSDEETRIYEKLKYHEHVGLCNVFVDVLKKRSIVEKQYLHILAEETKKLKDTVKVNVTNTEGLTRIVNAAALMVASCKLIEDHIPEFQLPFTYSSFFKIATEKILSQIEKISSTNKLSTFFQTISTLITHGKIIIGREIKIVEQEVVTVILPGKLTEKKEFTAGTKILYLAFEEIYVLYQNSIGKEEALSRQSLRAYFESNQAFVGQCKSTLFSWQVAEHSLGEVMEAQVEGDEIKTSNTARMRMVKKTKNTSAYMFNYNTLRALLDIDFERKEEEQNPNEVKPDDDKPF